MFRRRLDAWLLLITKTLLKLSLKEYNVGLRLPTRLACVPELALLNLLSKMVRSVNLAAVALLLKRRLLILTWNVTMVVITNTR